MDLKRTMGQMVVVAAVAAGCGGSPPPSGPRPVALPPALDQIKEAELRSDLFVLAGDRFRGREAGTLDELAASAWIAERARAAGLEPAGDDGTYFQFWPLARVRLSATSTIELGGTSVPLNRDALVITSNSVQIDAPLVPVGDGRHVAADQVRGKVAVVQITRPANAPGENMSIRQARYAFAAMVERLTVLAPMQPAAVVLISDAVADSGWSFAANWFKNGSYGLTFSDGILGLRFPVPVIWVRQSVGPVATRAGGKLVANLMLERFLYPSVNVVAKVRGTDPVLSREYVLFSAHQDHDGVKEPVAGDSIWNGADDNGSVSVGVLGIGRAFARRPAKRSALFVWHGAEEKGLLGSRYHALHPVVPKESIVAVLNADMIGANHPDTAALLGVQPPHRNSAELVAYGYQANAMVSRFVVDTLWDRPSHPEGWYFRSDHVPYAQAGIPALYFSSLPHPDYHTPRDEPSRIDYRKLTRIARWMYATGWLVANAPERVKLDPRPAPGRE